MPQTILISTVGGSHVPILRAIDTLRPDFISFVCTGKDPASGRPGSDIQINGKGSVIKAHPADERPSLPNIPAQAGLPESRFEVVRVPADDLDAVYVAMSEALAELATRFPEGRLIADYTGGTKTMSAALVVAALERKGVELQLVTGARTDLIRIRDGMEGVASVNAEHIRMLREATPFADAWRSYGYGVAAKGLAALRPPRDPTLRGQLDLLRDLSRAFDAWDRFDHRAAGEILEAYRPRIGAEMGLLLKTVSMLNRDCPQREPLCLFDLWRNAQRRASQGRFDDAVARSYRLFEWSAQWILRARCGIDTADVAADRIPDDIDLPPNSKGRRQAGLFKAWELVRRLTAGPPAEFIEQHGQRLLQLTEIRNFSIFGHGDRPITAGDWSRFAELIDSALIPCIRSEARTVDLRFEPPQLPAFYPAFLDMHRSQLDGSIEP